VKANVRVIAATHQDLEQRVKDGVFREDLFHRLNVIRLRLPALRERREDVQVLTKHFLLQSAQQLGVEPKRISEQALEILGQFNFPGNVRQLENICHWLTVMAPAQMIEAKDLPPEVLSPSSSVNAGPQLASSVGNLVPTSEITTASAALTAPPSSALVNLGSHAGWESALEVEALQLLGTDRQDVWDVLSRRFESLLIQAALATTRGRRIEAAVKLGIGRNTITRKIQELHIEG
jgi:two-component system nitrogen regulation response regulator GlnG